MRLSEEGVTTWRQVFDFWRQAYHELSYRGHQYFYHCLTSSPA